MRPLEATSLVWPPKVQPISADGRRALGTWPTQTTGWVPVRRMRDGAAALDHHPAARRLRQLARADPLGALLERLARVLAADHRDEAARADVAEQVLRQLVEVLHRQVHAGLLRHRAELLERLRLARDGHFARERGGPVAVAAPDARVEQAARRVEHHRAQDV